MNNVVFFILVALILVSSVIIGKKSGAKIKNDTDYFLSGRKLGFFYIFMTILATQLGGGAIIGTAEAAYLYGWKAISYSGGVALGLVFLAFGLGAKFRKMNVSTVPEIFKVKYKSESLRIFSSLLYILSMFVLLVAIGVSARKYALSIGFNSEIIFIIFWGIVIAYTTSGGLTAVTKTDILQIVFVLVAFSITFLFIPNIDDIPTQNTPQAIIDDIPWINWILIPCLSNMIGQDMAQRCFAAKSPKIVPYAMVAAAILLVIATLLPAYLGILAHKIATPIPGATILIEIVSILTNPYVTSIFSAAILMAILSTADSILCALSSNIALDFKFFKRSKTENNANSSKLITIIVGISAMIGSFFFDQIIPMMLVSYEITVSVLFVPIMGALMFKSPNKYSAISACATGILTFLYFLVFTDYPYKTLVCIVMSSLVFYLSEIIFRKKDESLNASLEN